MSHPANQGRQAYERGASLMSNPYTWPSVNKQAEQWESGFIKAQLDAIRNGTFVKQVHIARKGY